MEIQKFEYLENKKNFLDEKKHFSQFLKGYHLVKKLKIMDTSFKFYTYNSRSSGKLNIKYLKTITYQTRNIEIEVSKTTTIRKQKYSTKL